MVCCFNCWRVFVCLQQLHLAGNTYDLMPALVGWVSIPKWWKCSRFCKGRRYFSTLCLVQIWQGVTSHFCGAGNIHHLVLMAYCINFLLFLKLLHIDHLILLYVWLRQPSDILSSVWSASHFFARYASVRLTTQFHSVVNILILLCSFHFALINLKSL